MRALIPALLAFSFLMAAHLVFWRVRRPTGHYAGLTALCLAVLVVSVGSFYIVESITPGWIKFIPVTSFDYFNFVILYTGLALSYVVTYSAVQADSPTMTILLRIERSEPKGLALQQILDQLSDQFLVIPRLDDLVTGGLVRLHQGRYIMGDRGAFLAKINILYRALLKMEKGG